MSNRFRAVYESPVLSIFAWDLTSEPHELPTPPGDRAVFVYRGALSLNGRVSEGLVASPGGLLLTHRDQRTGVLRTLTDGARAYVLRFADRFPGREHPSGTDRTHGFAPLETLIRLKALLAILPRSGGVSGADVERHARSILGAAMDRRVGAERRDARGTGEETRSARRDAIERARLTMNERFGEALTLDQIASATCYSKYHLSRVFRAYTGITIHRYLTRVRLVTGLEMLGDGVSATEVAHRNGFSSSSHFSTSFVRAYGLTPSDARRCITDPSAATRFLESTPEPRS